MKIYLGTDHAGFELKNNLKTFLVDAGHEVIDLGALACDAVDDYPDFIVPVAEAVSRESGAVGIILGGSGQGEAIAANRVPGIRAALYYGCDENIVRLAREHNDANILSLGARFIDYREAINAVTLFLNTPFSQDPKHARRLKKIDKNQL